MFERFTDDARQVVVDAQEACRALGHRRIGSEHVLLAVLGAGRHPVVRRVAAEDLDPAAVRAAVAVLPGAHVPDAAALRAIGVDLDAIRDAAEAAFGPGALERPAAAAARRPRWPRRRRAGGHLPFSRHAKGVLERSLREALALGDRHIGSEHILLGILAEEGSAARWVVAGVGPDPDELLRRCRSELDGPDAAAG